MPTTLMQWMCAALALVLGAEALAQGYVVIGTPPPTVSLGELTIKNPGPQEIVFSLSASACKTTEVRIPANRLVKVGCPSVARLTTLLRTKMPGGEILDRRQSLATGVHCFVAVDDSGAYVLSTGTPALPLPLTR